jgi:uncharacterized protein with HEPN domain
MSKHRDEKHYLSDILESIEAIEIYLENISYEEFINDRKTCSATIRELEVIGEAVSKISDEIKAKYQDVLWQPIKDFRNKIVHEYFGIDYKMVWDIVKNELPILNSQISNIINDIV